MKALNEMVQLLKDDQEVLAFQRLESVLLTDETLLKEYKTLLAKQKRLVHHEVSRHTDLKKTRETYHHDLERLSDNPFIENYLTHQESINRMVQWIHATIEETLEASINEAVKTP